MGWGEKREGGGEAQSRVVGCAYRSSGIGFKRGGGKGEVGEGWDLIVGGWEGGWRRLVELPPM